MEDKKDKKDWLEKHSDASMVLFNVACEIRGLSDAFKITGNYTMYIALRSIAGDIEKANKDIRDAIGESIEEIIKRSGESSKAILEAALAGVMIATEPTNQPVNPTTKPTSNKTH